MSAPGGSQEVAGNRVEQEHVHGDRVVVHGRHLAQIQAGDATPTEPHAVEHHGPLQSEEDVQPLGHYTALRLETDREIHAARSLLVHEEKV